MRKKSYKNFEEAYKKVLRYNRNMRNIGAYTNIGDHRDVIHDAVANLLKRFDFNDDDFAVGEIILCLKRSIEWARLKKIRHLKNVNEWKNKQYISDFSYDSDQLTLYGYIGSKFNTFEVDLEMNNLNLVLSRYKGYTRGDEVKEGRFRTERIAQYAHEKEYSRFKKLLDDEARRLEVIHE